MGLEILPSFLLISILVDELCHIVDIQAETACFQISLYVQCNLMFSVTYIFDSFGAIGIVITSLKFSNDDNYVK